MAAKYRDSLTPIEAAALQALLEWQELAKLPPGNPTWAERTSRATFTLSDAAKALQAERASSDLPRCEIEVELTDLLSAPCGRARPCPFHDRKKRPAAVKG